MSVFYGIKLKPLTILDKKWSGILSYIMENLPKHSKLKTKALSQCFNDTTNAYKFYWFWAILEHIHEKNISERRQNIEIEIDELALRMISLAWHPLDYFKLSFGKVDRFKQLAKYISVKMVVDLSPQSKSLYHQIIDHQNEDLKINLKKKVKTILERWVIYRFIRPFFQETLRGLKDTLVNRQIKILANKNEGIAPYYIENTKIIVNAAWSVYINENLMILKGFISWHLVRFLQKNNSNVIGLSEKLQKPGLRNLDIAKKIWFKYLQDQNIICLYSNKTLTGKDISMDHFIPWSYMVHDQLWNIIPTTKSINSKKSDTLPSLGYLSNFCKLQFNFLQYLIINDKKVELEDYHTLFNVINLKELNYEVFSQKLKIELSNHIRIAENMGFSNEFIYNLG